MIRRAITAAALTLLAGCGSLTLDSPSAVVLPEAAAGSAAEAPDYDRDAFGNGWADLDGDRCDTRQEILARDLVDEVLDRDGCKVLTGTLHDTYTATTIHFVRGRTTSDDVQIDHRVPLAYAWHAGAYAWADGQREEFANDPANLVAVDGPTNNRKGADGPAEWMPPNPAAWCGYADAWAVVLDRYGLTVSPADAAKLADVEASCT